jgi:hypothetical protein
MKQPKPVAETLGVSSESATDHHTAALNRQRKLELMYAARAEKQAADLITLRSQRQTLEEQLDGLERWIGK